MGAFSMSEEQSREKDRTFGEWAILELMGHRRLAGYVQECQIGGAGFLRIDIPEADGKPPATQYYAPSAVYAITPTTEETAREVAQITRPAPVQRWELPAPRSSPEVIDDDEDDGDYTDDSRDFDEVDRHEFREGRG